MTRLSDDDLAVIASGPPDEGPASLAARLGQPYDTVKKAVRRIRRHGWYTAVTVAPCTACGRPLVSRTGAGRRRVHPLCELADHNARQRAAFANLPAERRRASLAKVSAADRRDHELTWAHAAHGGEPWDEADTAYLLEHPDMPARDVGLALGRTNVAVRQKRARLRRSLEARRPAGRASRTRVPIEPVAPRLSPS